MKRLAHDPALLVKAYSMFDILYEGTAYALSTQNRLGPLDILPGHANMISILNNCSILLDTTNGEKKFNVAKGLLKVSANRVTVFIS